MQGIVDSRTSLVHKLAKIDDSKEPGHCGKPYGWNIADIRF